jgi:3-hydroxypropionyl-coenzyme A dehydratase
MPGGTVVVVGSINADLVVTLDHLPAAGETVIGGRFARHGGGKGANQAIAAARAGARVRFVGAVGDDDFGHAALAELEGEGIDVTAVAKTSEPTGVALIAVDREGRNQIAVASGANATVDGSGIGALGPDDVCLLGFEVPDAAVVAGARAAKEAGARIVLNPAPARDLSDALLDLGVILTPNALELTALTNERDPERAARALSAVTEAPVIVTLGERGALLVGDERIALVPAPRVEVVDTTGAGDVRCVVLASTHETTFSSGGNLAGFAADVPLVHKHHESTTRFPALFTLIGELGKPVLCAARGHCLAGALGLALACDLVIASETATFGTPEINVGVFPFMIMALIFRNVPRKKAAELLLLGERIDAREAERLGIVNRVVAPDAFDEAVADWAQRLAKKSPVLMRMGKDAMFRSQDMALEDALAYLRAQLTIAFSTDDIQEGVQAFFEKREPVWKGR